MNFSMSLFHIRREREQPEPGLKIRPRARIRTETKKGFHVWLLPTNWVFFHVLERNRSCLHILTLNFPGQHRVLPLVILYFLLCDFNSRRYFILADDATSILHFIQLIAILRNNYIKTEMNFNCLSLETFNNNETSWHGIVRSRDSCLNKTQ